MRKTSGFSFIELLVTVTIVGVLMVGAVVSYRSSTAKARDTKRINDLEQVRTALDMYKADNGTYIITAGWVSLPVALETGSYINDIPVDPQSGTTTPYRYRSLSDGYAYELNANLDNPIPDTCDDYISGYDYCVKNP